MPRWIRRLPRPVVLVAMLALVAAACFPGDGDEPDEPGQESRRAVRDGGGAGAAGVRDGGTVVWGLSHEPETLLPIIAEGNRYATSQIVLATLLPLWRITPGFEHEPTALLADYAVAGRDMDPGANAADLAPAEQFRVTYFLDEDATWSDGEPITARDLLFTIRAHLHPDVRAISRAGWDAIDVATTRAHADPEASELTVYFERPYAPWKGLFNAASGVVLPEHVLGDHPGAELNTVFADGIVDPDTGEPIASGPFKFDTWQRGERVTLVRNERYGDYAGADAHLERLVYRILLGTAQQVQHLRGGEIDLVDPQVQLGLLEQIERIAGIDHQVAAGPTWEHLDFQHTHPLLGRRWVRTAIAHGIDRRAFVRELVRPVLPDAEPLGNHAYVATSQHYRDHFDWLDHDRSARSRSCGTTGAGAATMACSCATAGASSSS